MKLPNNLFFYLTLAGYALGVIMIAALLLLFIGSIWVKLLILIIISLIIVTTFLSQDRTSYQQNRRNLRRRLDYLRSRCQQRQDDFVARRFPST